MDGCVECGRKVPHNNASGRLSRWDTIKAGDAGWFFMKDGTTYCPEHVPDWVEGWRKRKQAEKDRPPTPEIKAWVNGDEVNIEALIAEMELWLPKLKGLLP